MELNNILRQRYYELDKLIHETPLGTALSVSLQMEKDKVKELMWQRKITDELMREPNKTTSRERLTELGWEFDDDLYRAANGNRYVEWGRDCNYIEFYVHEEAADFGSWLSMNELRLFGEYLEELKNG